VGKQSYQLNFFLPVVSAFLQVVLGIWITVWTLWTIGLGLTTAATRITFVESRSGFSRESTIFKDSPLVSSLHQHGQRRKNKYLVEATSSWPWAKIKAIAKMIKAKNFIFLLTKMIYDQKK
jgi:hypothetical protein